MSNAIADRIAISAEAFVAMLHTIRGATMVSFISATEPDMRAGNPYPGLRKVSKVGATLNFDYAAAVNRQRVREGMVADFVAEPRKWGERVKGTPLVTHKGRWYVEAKVERSEVVAYIMPDLSPVDPELVAGWLKARHGGRQGVERTVILRDFSVENIRSMRIKGVEYIID
jgi:hypothetical protein